jgi:hypothetical protein
MEHHAGAVDLSDLQGGPFLEAQATSVDRGETDAIAWQAETAEHTPDLLATQNDGEFLLLGRADEVQGRPGTLHSMLIEKLDSTEGDGGCAARDPLLVAEIEEIVAQFLFSDEVRGFADVLREELDGLDIPALRVGRQATQLHVIDHTLA